MMVPCTIQLSETYRSAYSCTKLSKMRTFPYLISRHNPYLEINTCPIYVSIVKKTIFTKPLLFHIAISDQNRQLDAILHMSLDFQSAQRQRTQRGNVSDHIWGYYAFLFLCILHYALFTNK